MKLRNTLYTAAATSTGGRDGQSKTDDGQLVVKLAAPQAMGGHGDGTNPEQLFAAGYSACFLGAMKFVAGQQGKAFPSDATVGARIGIGPLDREAPGFGITAALQVKLPGWAPEAAQQLVQAAHEVCPYSNATRGNLDVVFDVTV